MRAFVLHKTLSAVYEVTVLCFEQVGLSADAIRVADGVAATLFVDELLSLCSELTCLAVSRLPCEVAVARRCGAPVVSGRVPPVITPWSGGRAGEPRRTPLRFPSQEPSRRSSDDSLGLLRAAFRTAGFKQLAA